MGTISPPQPPGPLRWHLPDPDSVEDDLIAVGADLEPSTLLEAYRVGLFPMGLGEHGRGPIGWWSPCVRGVIPPGAIKVRRSTRQSAKRFEIRFDTAFEEVIRACADPARDGRWITSEILHAYTRLHELGWAHSVETWCQGRLVGGLYGIHIGGLFAGESMFHRQSDASKVALVALAERFFADADPARIIDVQWATPHLMSLGAQEWPRARYLEALERAVELPAVRF